MKNKLWVVLLLSLLLIGSDKPVDLVRLTIINKSGYDLSIWLNGREQEEFYYFAILKGDRDEPTIKVYTIFKDTYEMKTAFTKPYDPVYPRIPCVQHKPTALIAMRNIRLTFTDCGQRPPNAGEPSLMKFWTVITPLFDVKWRFIY